MSTWAPELSARWWARCCSSLGARATTNRRRSPGRSRRRARHPPPHRVGRPRRRSRPSSDRVSLPALMREDFHGGRIRVRREILANDAYTRSEVTYPSGDVTVSGVLLRPTGQGPFPAVVLNHGYIEPSVYVTGQGLMREQDYLARAGFVVLHTDYRGYAASDATTDRERETRLGYTRDTINAVESVKRLRYVDPDRVAMLGPLDGRRHHAQRARGQTGTRARSRGVRAGELGLRRQLQPLDRARAAGGGDGDLPPLRHAAAGPGLLRGAVSAHLLRPDHRTSAHPPRHRRRVLPHPVVADHPAVAGHGRGRLAPRDLPR